MLDREWLGAVRSRLRGERALACLDFDGTLAPIVDDPEEAALRPDVAERLRVLADHAGVVTAIVSGRSLSDLRERVGIDGLHYAGNHGLEVDLGDGREVDPAARESAAALAAAVERLRGELAETPGCTVEDKALTATVHVRQVPTEDVPDVAATVDSVVDGFEGLCVTPGRGIYEVRPDIDAGKDRAVERLRARYPDAVPLFVGDDVTDEDGFEAVADDGYGVLVGQRADSAASVRVPDIDGVALLLGWLVQVCDDSPDVPADDGPAPSTG